MKTNAGLFGLALVYGFMQLGILDADIGNMLAQWLMILTGVGLKHKMDKAKTT